jgi:prepilin-type processing-associated H-X9-DG protein
MVDAPEVRVTIVRPGGTATVGYADGHETMRVATGYLHDPHDGLIAEMQAGREPVPWKSEAIRDEALWTVEIRLGLDDETRRGLLDWIAGTAYFVDA